MIYSLDHDLVEVHSVRIVRNQIASHPESEFYGYIRLEDVFNEEYFYLYKQTRDNAKSTGEDATGTLSFTGPNRCVSGIDFALAVRLKERHQDQDLDVGSGYYWLTPNTYDTFVDKHVRCVFEGNDGYSIVHFTIVMKAIQATMEVALITTDDNRSATHVIHGSLVASSSSYSHRNEYDRKYFKTILFSAPEDKPQQLKPPGPDDENKSIFSLSRDAVAVTYGHKLIIEADLSVRPIATATGVSEPLAQTVEIISFEAHCGTGPSGARKESKSFNLGDARIEVTVTFLAPPPYLEL